MIYKINVSALGVIDYGERAFWCMRQFGGNGLPNYHLKNNIVKDMRWWLRQRCIYFREEQDYILFLLRWS